LEPNFAEKIFVWPSTKIPHFILIQQKTWLPWPILGSVWLKLLRIFSIETIVPIGTKLCKNVVFEVLYRDSSFHLDPAKT
jgi:hypothetical protein